MPASSHSAPPSPRRFPYAVVAVTVCYTLLAAVVCWGTGNREFVLYIGVMVVLGAALGAVYRKVALSRVLLWCFSGWGLLHMAGGLLPVPETWPVEGPNRVLYSLWLIPGRLKYDQVVHFYGFGITTWLCWQALSARLRRREPDPFPSAGLLILCAAGGMGFGALNEVVEFIATLTLPETNVGGYENTGWDLVANLLGCVTAAVLIRLGHTRGAVRRPGDSPRPAR